MALSNDSPPSIGEKESIIPILEAIDRYERGQFVPGGGLLKFYISELEHQELEEKLSENLFFQAKISRDFFPSERLFIIRRPTPIHECFLVKPFPGVVTEAAYSQDGKRLPHLADAYILDSNLDVRVLLAFDIQYKKNKASVSVWRPHAVPQDGEEAWITASETQVFREDNGEPNLDPRAGLRVNLRDFVSVELCETFENLEGSVFISCATLCTFLNQAEAKIDVKPRPRRKLVSRAPAPEEELNTDDERDMVRAKKHAEEKADRSRSFFQSSSLSMSEEG
ncbi:hypothetical protein AYO20_09410 [Fonsecaea nubica]|uniref:Uncharacterized protein n=1 Tax=Fonsecaea nubica TaxID=856822 RepID=A0A178CHG0_9EURO|nr:hypothetical protein AYO20_09410 [Fonsecaea nubica]OAL28686.1 hypothetical protein AYO20_09410 [Fonsecaea nubica]